MDPLLPWERPLWSRRGLRPPRSRDLISDVRVAHLDGPRSWEIPVADIAEVECIRTRLDRLTGRFTLIVRPRDPRRPSHELRHVRNGAAVAALIELAASAPSAIDDAAAAAALAWKPASGLPVRALVGPAALIITVGFVVAIGVDGREPPRVHGPEDAIAPGGVKRSREDIVRFMEEDVMPWARAVLGPLKGGPSAVTCATCHGDQPDAQDWRMPAVARLPEPALRTFGSEVLHTRLDPQAHNALFGYLAEADNQSRAAYMREVVLPGMARLLHREPYDFTKPYWHNRDRMTFGCYHCHKV